MKSTISRPLTAEELTLCQDLAAMATEHDEHGCPAVIFDKAISQLFNADRNSVVGRYLMMCSYSDGRSCPAHDLKHAGKRFLLQHAEFGV